jgi:DNA (cytosine-5)-methyltransferase 1
MHPPLRLSTLELFAGGGGAALGLREAGFVALRVVERDPAAAATLRNAGFPTRVLDIDPSGENFLWTWNGTPIGVLWSSPPCQPFSQSGDRQGASDTRDRWPATLRILAAVKPQVFVGENVSSFARHDRDCAGSTPETCSGCAFDHVTRAVAAQFPYAGVWTLDAADFGVPQHRTRVFVWGSHVPLQAPVPTFGPGTSTPWRTMRDAIGESLLDPNRRHYLTDGSAGRAGSEPERLDRPSPTVMTTEVKGTRASAASGWTFHGGPDRASDATFLALGVRRITPSEAAALQAFPPDHPFAGSTEAIYTQIGNAVAPPVALAIGRAIRASWAQS